MGHEDDNLTGPIKRAVTTGPVEKPVQAAIRGIAIIAVVVLALIDLRTPDESVPVIVYGSLIGLALGVDAGWLGRLVK